MRERNIDTYFINVSINPSRSDEIPPFKSTVVASLASCLNAKDSTRIEPRTVVIHASLIDPARSIMLRMSLIVFTYRLTSSSPGGCLGGMTLRMLGAVVGGRRGAVPSIALLL